MFKIRHFIQLYIILVFVNFCACPTIYNYNGAYVQLSQQQFHRYKELNTIYEAKNLEFGFPSATERQATIRDGRYNPDSALPIDVDVFYTREYETSLTKT